MGAKTPPSLSSIQWLGAFSRLRCFLGPRGLRREGCGESIALGFGVRWNHRKRRANASPRRAPRVAREEDSGTSVGETSVSLTSCFA